MSTTPILGITELAPSQSSPHIPINTATRALEVFGQITVINQTTTYGPASPSEGDAYIVGASPTGTWSGKAKQIAYCIGGAWKFFTPQAGWLAFDQSLDAYYTFDGTDWNELDTGESLPIGGTTGQILVKQSGIDGDADWETPSGGGGGSGSLVAYSDPAYQWFGATGQVIDSSAGQISADPVLVWDGTQFVMFLGRTVSGSPYVRCYYRTAPTLLGPWSSATELTDLAGYHKPVVLVDEQGSPVQLGGDFHIYAVSYTGTLGSKEIWHFTASSLTGPWTLGSKVIAKGGSGDKDEYNTDAPCALYKDGTTYIWYMGAPASSLTTYGYATRKLRATASDPDGPFTKDATEVLTPSTSSSDWDYGWMGGTQILLRPDGSYMMVYNAGDTRPSSAGTEPNASHIGYAYSNSIDGPWTKDRGNPYVTPTGVTNDAIEQTNCWRPYLAWDPSISEWVLFYNAGGGGGATDERITYATQNSYLYEYTSVGSPYNVQALTTSVAAITNSRVNLPPGSYRVHAQFNVIGDGSGSNPALTFDTFLRVNGSAVGMPARDYIGNYAYENRDVVVESVVRMNATGHIDLAVQVTSGTPVANSLVRRLRMNVQKLT